MSLTRRRFLERTAGVAGALAVGCAAGRSRNREILVNHLGFTLRAAKTCLLQGTQSVPFTVVNVATGTVAHSGTMGPIKGDLGDYVLGRFDDLTTPGDFEIDAGGLVSGRFSISDSVYESAVTAAVGYFAKQRCGNSTTGHHAPCHLDDGKRTDDGRHQDVTGGWHDACDLRKWVQATLYGMLGLGRVLEAERAAAPRAAIIDELRWGNAYFRKMQEPDGYVMDYCGGDDGNRYTDNAIGTPDDRPLHVDPCELPVQFHFVSAQAAMARATSADDPAYSRECQAAAERCLRWCRKNRDPGAAISLAAATIACIGLHKLTRADDLTAAAAEYLGKLLALQAKPARDGDVSTGGFFHRAPDRPEPSREIMHGNLPLLALTEALACWPGHSDATQWRSGLKLHTDHLLAMSQRSAFGIVPFGLYSGTDPGGNRRAGGYWYRYFMKPKDEEASAAWWWVGINAHVASTGIGLARAGRLLSDSRLLEAAQHQLDWILGVNPFNCSTITGVGCNQPRLYTTTTFSPATPLINGGVMNGIGGGDDDEPRLDAGSWNTCEYWTPMVAYAMWLFTSLGKADA